MLAHAEGGSQEADVPDQAGRHRGTSRAANPHTAPTAWLAHRPCDRFFEKVTLPPWTGTSSIQVWPAGTSSF
jgi:hypothetical protein